MYSPSIRVTEIFHSIQGESTSTGFPTVFIRLTGCPLRCHYCDTSYAFSGGDSMQIAAIMSSISDFRCTHVTVTGGEPLAQPQCLLLLTELAEAQYQVSIETSGALPINDIDSRVRIVMDLKTPSSGECQRNLWDNIACLKASDEIKFVIGTLEDYRWAQAKIQIHGLNERVHNLLFSPVQGQLAADQLATWILRDRLPVRLQIQLHKYLWGDQPGR